MKKTKLNKRHTDQEYNDTTYDSIRNLLEITRKQNFRNLIIEQEEGEYETSDIEVETEKEVEEKTKEYNVSGGIIITHGIDEMDLELTDDEKGGLPRDHGRLC